MWGEPAPSCFISELQTWENEIMLDLTLIMEHLLQARVHLITLHHCNFISSQQSLVVLTSHFILQRKEQTEAGNMDATCLGLPGSERSTAPGGRRSVMGVGWGSLEHSGSTLFPEFARGAPTAALGPARVSRSQGPRGARRARPGRRAGGGEGAGTKAAATALRSARAAANSGGGAGTRDSQDVAARRDEAPQAAPGARAGRARRPAARTAPSAPSPASAPSPPPRGGRGGSALGEHGGGGGRAGHFT